MSMTGFKSKRRETTDLLEAEQQWEQEKVAVPRYLVVWAWGVAIVAATGFFLGFMSAMRGG